MSIKIVLPADPTWQAHWWAKEHCASYITNTPETTCGVVPGPLVSADRIVYYFGHEHDALIFALKWK